MDFAERKSVGARRRPWEVARAECFLQLVARRENRVAVTASDETRPGDVHVYVSDTGLLAPLTYWRPTHGPRQILEAVFSWINEYEHELRPALGLG